MKKPDRIESPESGCVFRIDNYGVVIYNSIARRGTGANNKRAGGWLPSPRGGELMRITFHIGKYTVTIIVYERKKQASRHSAK